LAGRHPMYATIPHIREVTPGDGDLLLSARDGSGIESQEVSLFEVQDPSSQAIEAAKRSLRSEIRSRIAGVDAGARITADLAIGTALAAWSGLTTPRVVCGFLPLRDEPDLRSLLRGLLRRGVRIAVPEVVPGSQPALRMLEIGQPEALDDTRPSTHGTRVPIVSRTIELQELGVVLTPGVAFDRLGGRLGRGGGHFDALLATVHGQVVSVGIAYEAQIVDAVPRERHDLAVDWLCTERGIARAG